MFSNLEFKIAALLSGSFNASDTLVSSAEKFYNRFNIFGYVVYIYMRNNKGPNTVELQEVLFCILTFYLL